MYVELTFEGFNLFNRTNLAGINNIVGSLPPAELRELDPLGADARQPDRTALVRADDDVLLSVEEIGPPDAPLTVVFVHGYTLSMASWTFQRRTLASELATANGHRPEARLVFYDQRGHGSSARGPAEHCTLEQLARDLAAVVRARAPRGPVVLVGHSMGGMTIIALAALRPEMFGTKIAAVALISTSSGNLAGLTFGLPELLTRVRAAVFPVAAWTMRRRPALAERTRRLAADIVSAVTWSLSFASRDVDPALGRYVDAMIAGTPVDVIAEFYPALAGMDETGSLTPLRRVPTLVITGDDDKMIPREHSDLIVERLGRAGGSTVEYVVVPEAGHLVLMEKPDQVTAALTGLLRRVAAERPADRPAS
jgi:pimeloyl-ACP methyl ester carboxylesterase